MYIDLLEYGVYHHIDDDKKLNLVGIYDVEGNIIYVKILAKKFPHSIKYWVSSLEIIDMKQYNEEIEIIREIELKNMYLHDFFK